MSGMFAPAKRSNRKLRLALNGLPGTGKSMTALKIAKGICQRIEEVEGRPATICVIDTEQGSAELYAGEYRPGAGADWTCEFGVCKLGIFDPLNYIEAIKAAERYFDVIIIDSMSPAWAGEGGSLSKVDAAAKRSQSGNTFAAWRDVTPAHNAFVDKIVRCSRHVIGTMRLKAEYVTESVNGKMSPKKIGMAPIMREGVEYEFDIVGDMTANHELMIGKTRYSPFDLKIFARPGEEIGYELATWLSSPDRPGPDAYAAPAMGRTPAAQPQVATPPGRQSEPVTALAPELSEPRAAGLASDDQVNQVYELFDTLGMSEAGRLKSLTNRGVASVESLSAALAEEMISRMVARAEQVRAEAAAIAATEESPAAREMGQAMVDMMTSPTSPPRPGTDATEPTPESQPLSGPADAFVIPDAPRREGAEPAKKKTANQPEPSVA